MIIRLLLLLLVSVPLAAMADQTDEYIKAQMAEHRIPGLAIKVISQGKPLKTSAYGLANVELGVPVRPATVFEIGSVSKQFTAAGILLLEQEGKLSVDDLISKHLANTPASWSNITIRHLLTHTSGLKSYTGLDGFALTKHLTQAEFIEAIGKQPHEFPPGERFKYCNTGFNLLGFIIENVSGQKYWDFMRERIFRPLLMTSTQDRNPGTIITNRADGYEQKNHKWINRDYDVTDIFSAGAIVSTVEDLAKWNAALDRDDLLSGATRDKMWTNARLNSGKETGYGFGWFLDTVQGHKNIGHGGSTSGFSASIQRFPQDALTVIILSNTDEQIATTLAKKIATFYFAKSIAAEGSSSHVEKTASK